MVANHHRRERFWRNSQNAYNSERNGGPAASTVRTCWILKYIYEFAVLPDRSKMTGKLLGGWQFSGITPVPGWRSAES